MTNFKRNNYVREKSLNSGVFWYCLIGISALFILFSFFNVGIISKGIRMVTVGLFGVFSYLILAQIIVFSVLRLINRTPFIKFGKRLIICLITVFAFVIAHTVFSLNVEEYGDFNYYFNYENSMLSPAGGLGGLLVSLLNELLSPTLSIVLFSLAGLLLIAYLLKDFIKEKLSLMGRARRYSEKTFKKKYPEVYVTAPSSPIRSRLFIEDLSEIHRDSYEYQEVDYASVSSHKAAAFDPTSENIMRDFSVKEKSEEIPSIQAQPKTVSLAGTSASIVSIESSSPVAPKATLHEGQTNKTVIIPNSQKRTIPERPPRIYSSVDFRQQPAASAALPQTAKTPDSESVLSRGSVFVSEKPTSQNTFNQNIVRTFIKPTQVQENVSENEGKVFVSSFKKPEEPANNVSISSYKDELDSEKLPHETPNDIYPGHVLGDGDEPKNSLPVNSATDEDRNSSHGIITSLSTESESVPDDLIPNSPDSFYSAQNNPEEYSEPAHIGGAHFTEKLDDDIPDGYDNVNASTAETQFEENPSPAEFTEISDDDIIENVIPVPLEEDEQVIEDVIPVSEEFNNTPAPEQQDGPVSENYYQNDYSPISDTSQSLTEQESAVQAYDDLTRYTDVDDAFADPVVPDLSNLEEPSISIDQIEDIAQPVSEEQFDVSELVNYPTASEQPSQPQTMTDENGSLTIENNPPVDLSERTEIVDPNNDNTGVYIAKKPEKPKKRGKNALDPNQMLMDFEPEYKFKEMAPSEHEEEYVAPGIEFFEYSDVLNTGYDEAEEKVRILEEKISELGFPAKVTDIVCGPSVIRFELTAPPKMSVSKIKSFEKDIQAALAVTSLSISAPVPGKSVIGIEIRKTHPSMVRLRDFYESEQFKSDKNMLSIPMGYTIDGRMVVSSIKSLAHLLVGGQTRSGKSVFLNTILLSLIYKYSPKDLRLILIDPKQVEFVPYEKLPHMIVPHSLHYEISNNTNYPVRALQWLIEEMERRYHVFKSVHEIHPDISIRNIGEFNNLKEVREGEWQKMPYIVCLMDEFQELCTYDKKDIITCVARLSSKSAASGIHLIVATQRPDVKVIDGTIKNNLPGRIAFKLESFVDSRTILDTEGAESLGGNGDMLFKTAVDGIIRLQAPFNSSECVTEVTNFIRDNNNSYFIKEAEDFILAPPKEDLGEIVSGSDAQEDDEDSALYPEIMRIFMKKRSASTSMIQTKYRFGYNRAKRIIEYFEDKGYISEMNGQRNREIYMTKEKFELEFGEPFDEGEF